ncbi:putative Cytochrome P450 [Seiridium cardinale]|uniref:Cytochrome P450 n=1 Tax=Seiridium cardinale TaxID=138064 RepID=A0ABR2YA04_9PEZI
MFPAACVGVKEVYTWMPTATIGIPRAVTADGNYLAYQIPKGKIIIPNIWGNQLLQTLTNSQAILAAYPEVFPANFTPRSVRHAHIIRSEWEESQQELNEENKQ